MILLKKSYFILIFLLLLAFPKGVYAYSKIEYYDFAYIMSNKGYYVEYKDDLVSFDDDSFSEKYYFYPSISAEESHEYIDYLLSLFGDVPVDFVEKDNYSYFSAQWMNIDFERYEYCFEYSSNIICGTGSVKLKDKIKKNVDDLFSDDVFKTYDLDKLRTNLKDINTSNWEFSLDKLGIELYDDSPMEVPISSDDNVSKKEKSSFGNFVYLGIGIAIISILFGVISVILLKRKKKTS